MKVQFCSHKHSRLQGRFGRKRLLTRTERSAEQYIKGAKPRRLKQASCVPKS